MDILVLSAFKQYPNRSWSINIFDVQNVSAVICDIFTITELIKM